MSERGEWEPFDDDLAGALRRRAGSAGHDPLAIDAAHRSVLARASAVRRRRATAAGGGALVVLLVGGLVLLNGGGEGDDQVATGTLPESTPVTTTATTAPATFPSTTIPGSVEWSAPGSTVVLTIPPPTEPVPTMATVPGSAPPSSAGSSTSVPSNTTPPGEYRYNSTGGTITVIWDGSTLALGPVEPAAGYAAEVEDEEPDRVRVRFRGGDDPRIDCRVENGRLVVEIT